jgi:hypothetical protein
MTKALDAPWFRPDLKSPWCASAMYQTLTLVIRYFYRFRGSSMSSQSVDIGCRERRKSRAAVMRRSHQTRFVSASDDEVGGFRSAMRERLGKPARVADLRRLGEPYAHGGRHRCCTQYRDPGRAEHPCSLGQTAAGCH